MRGLVQRSGLDGPAPYRVDPYRTPWQTLEKMSEHALGARGERSHAVRQFTEFVIRFVAPKDYLGEILAIRNAFVQPSPWLRDGTPLFRYTNDPRHVELVKDPERIVDEIRAHGTCLLDCDESAQMAATMLLTIGREVELVALGFQPEVLSHVAVRAREPKSGRWVFLDGVAGPREREAAERAKVVRPWPVGGASNGVQVLHRKSLD